MCHDNEEWFNIWRGIDLSVQNWHVEFDEFWLEHTKNSRNCTVMGCLWPKYVMFELKKVQRSYFWWHWRLIKNLKGNWLVLSKITWRIWQIFVHFKTTRLTRCSVKTWFYLWYKWIAQLAKFFTHVVQNRCS